MTTPHAPLQPSFCPLFLSPVPAGFPSSSEGNIDQNLDLNALLVSHPAATFFVRVEGDSMQGAGIFSGDLLVIDRSLQVKNDHIVLAVINGEFTVKRLKIQQKEIHLVPENPTYRSIKVTEAMDFQIWGIVTYVIHKT